MTKKKTHIELNNDMMKTDENGQLQFDKDKEAVKAFFVDYVNMNMAWFHDLEEKINYLVENDYYEEDLIFKYSMEDM